jgi:hypothetical protein
MPKHHSEDYKISAVKHYLIKSKNLTKTYEYGLYQLKILICYKYKPLI